MSSKSKKKVYRKTIINNIKKPQEENPQKFSDILSIPSNPEDIFTLISPIGHGAFGTVYKAMHNASKQMYAIKIIQYFKEEHNLMSNLNHMENINFCYKTVQEETSLMRLVNSSDYIVKYYGSYFSRQTNTLWLILEYCASGSVIDLMLAMDRTYTEIEIATIVKMILQGLILIHSKNLIHRDVKGANILLSEEGIAKIGDFGVGVKLNKDLENLRKSKKGSPYWMSPQVVLNEGYSTGTDIWSLGITCLELINGEPPNSSLKPMEVMEKIGRCQINFDELFGEKNNFSEDFKDFVKKCLVIEEKKRAKAKELINHKFIVKKSKDNKLLSNLYKKHINDLEDYRQEVEEYEMELKMKKKKEREQQILSQKQKEMQNMSIKYESEGNQDDLNNINNNNINKSNDDELFYNKSINSLFINNNLVKDNNINTSEKEYEEEDEEEECEYDSSLLNNNSIKYIDNIGRLPKTKKFLCSPNGNIFDNININNNKKERYANTFSNDINILKKGENELTSDIVNQSSNLYRSKNFNNKSINITEYTLESNISNNNYETSKKNNKNTYRSKNSNIRKNKIKCRVINFSKPMSSRQKNNNSIGINKTMDNKRENSFYINQKLLFSSSEKININISNDKNINEINKRKSFNIIKNIKSISILNNKDIAHNNENIQIKNEDSNLLEEENEFRYKPIMTEDNIRKNKITAFNKFINNHKQLKNKENKNMLNKTTDNTNTYDNSNSNFNTNNISNNLSFINNTSYLGYNQNIEKNKNHSTYSIKNYSKNKNSQNININNEDNKNRNDIFEIPINNKCVKSYRELKEFDNNSNSNINMSNNIEEIEINNLICNKREKSSSFCINIKHEEDINDSDDDGVINKVNNLNSKDNLKEINKNKENIDKNLINKDVNNKSNRSTITSRSVHSYSIIDSTEFLPCVHNNNIFSNAHKKYFS
jgi:serine/threonine protein kinase